MMPIVSSDDAFVKMLCARSTELMFLCQFISKSLFFSRAIKKLSTRGQCFLKTIVQLTMKSIRL